MSIDKRGTNKYRFRVQFQGRQYTQMFYGTERETKKAHEKFKYHVKSGEVNIQSEMPFHEFAQIFYDEYVSTLRYGTQQIYKNNFNKHIIPVIGKYKLKDISMFVVQQLINDLKKEYSPNTVKNINANLTRAFNYALKWEFIEKNPCVFITLPKVIRHNMSDIYSIEDITKLINIYENETNLLHKSAFCLAIGCGLRNSEIRALTLNDVDFKNNTVTVSKQVGRTKGKDGKTENKIVEPKTESSKRTIFMPIFVTEVLKAYIKSLPFIPISESIYYSCVTRREISSHCISKRFTFIIADNGLPALRFHDLRHIHATLLIHSGANIQATAKRMGHSSIKTTIQTYIHSMEDVDKTTSDLLDKTYSGITDKKTKVVP